jgi:solute carrier family 30 (zinc transporter), member 5/7
VLDYDVDAFWLVMRVLACGGLAVVVWEASTNQLVKKTNIEVSLGTHATYAVVPIDMLPQWSVLGMSSVLVFVQQMCLFAALRELSCMRLVYNSIKLPLTLQHFIVPFSTVLFTQFSSVLVQSVMNPVSVMPRSHS